jgi:hypothetical protein
VYFDVFSTRIGIRKMHMRRIASMNVDALNINISSQLWNHLTVGNNGALPPEVTIELLPNRITPGTESQVLWWQQRGSIWQAAPCEAEGHTSEASILIRSTTCDNLDNGILIPEH